MPVRERFAKNFSIDSGSGDQRSQCFFRDSQDKEMSASPHGQRRIWQRGRHVLGMMQRAHAVAIAVPQMHRRSYPRQ
jgi:hypothetical protein